MRQSVLGLVQLVEDLESKGAIELAASVCVTLLKALNVRWPCQSTCEEAVSGSLAPRIGQVAYLVALRLLQLRAAPEATHILHLLGCTHRLSDAVLQSSIRNAVASAYPSPPDSNCPSTLFPALPGDIFQALKRGFSDRANFWSETGYLRQDSAFSSILYDLSDKPGNTIEAAICSLHKQLKNSHLDMAGILAAEWWVHMRDPTSAHQLHFDLDEGSIAAGAAKYRLVHPVLSSVLYLLGVGGPTVVLEQSARGGLAERAFLGTPSENTLLCFPGNYLHGVLPGRQLSSNAPGGGQRISLIIAWWGRAPGAKPGAPGTGPCRALPSSSEALRAQHGQTWLADFELAGLGRTPLKHTSAWTSVAAAAPAWEPVAASPRELSARVCAAHVSSSDERRVADRGAALMQNLDAADRLVTGGLPLPGLRVFLRSADEIQRVYVPE